MLRPDINIFIVLIKKYDVLKICQQTMIFSTLNNFSLDVK